MVEKGSDKKATARNPGERDGGRLNWKKLLLLFLGRGRCGSLGGLRLGEALLEFINASGGIDELLLAGVERMADVANTDNDRFLHGTGLDDVAAGATNFRFLIIWMNVSSHKNSCEK